MIGGCDGGYGNSGETPWGGGRSPALEPSPSYGGNASGGGHRTTEEANNRTKGINKDGLRDQNEAYDFDVCMIMITCVVMILKGKPPIALL